jgi:hypothetical protein
MGWLSDLWGRAKNWVSGAYNTVKSGVSDVWNKYVKPVVSKIPLVGGSVVGAVEGLGKSIDTGVQGLGNLAEGKLKEFGKNALKLGVEHLGGKIPLVGGYLAGKVNEQVDKLKKGGVVRRAPKVRREYQK